MKLYKSFLNIFKNIAQILKNENNNKERYTVLYAYSKITFMLLLTKFLKKKRTEETFFDFSIKCFDYEIFYWLFYEIFIKKEYIFQAKTTTPFIVDCGSNIGMSILFFKRLYPDSEILCFEPDKETGTVLQENIKKNALKKVAVHNIALHKKEGHIPFYLDAETAGKLAMSVTKQGEEHGIKIKETKVDAKKLSTFLTKSVDFLKLDVEGAETFVLEDLEESKKLSLIKEMFIEYHYSTKNPENKLSTILAIIERNNLKYCINADLELPFEKWKEKAYNLSIYAYRGL